MPIPVTSSQRSVKNMVSRPVNLSKHINNTVSASREVMSPRRYGNINVFAAELKKRGYHKVELIDTTNGVFMTPKEAKRL